MIAAGQKFEKQTISLDGGTFRDCEFVDCVLFFSGLLPVDLRGSSLKGCRWEFHGPAGNTIGFLRALYQRGETSLIESVFEDISKDAAPPAHDREPHSHSH
jgi:hypothetical protein